MGILSDELSRGDITGYITRNPASAVASVAAIPMTMGYSLIGSGIGRGIDSYNQSVFADNALQAAGIHATGPRGQDRTTSAWADFFGRDARDQKNDIIEEVKQEIADAKTWNPDTATSSTNTSNNTFYTTMSPVTSTDLNPPGWTGTLTNSDIAAQEPFTQEASSLTPSMAVTSLSQPAGPETGRFAGPQYQGTVSYPNAVPGLPGMPVTTYDNRVALPGATNLTPGAIDDLIASDWLASTLLGGESQWTDYGPSVGDGSSGAGDSQGGGSGIGSGSFDDGGQDASGYGGFGF
jgi:hypothetical protein